MLIKLDQDRSTEAVKVAKNWPVTHYFQINDNQWTLALLVIDCFVGLWWPRTTNHYVCLGCITLRNTWAASSHFNWLIFPACSWCESTVMETSVSVFNNLYSSPLTGGKYVPRLTFWAQKCDMDICKKHCNSGNKGRGGGAQPVISNQVPVEQNYFW